MSKIYIIIIIYILNMLICQKYVKYIIIEVKKLFSIVYGNGHIFYVWKIVVKVLSKVYVTIF